MASMKHASDVAAVVLMGTASTVIHAKWRKQFNIVWGAGQPETMQNIVLNGPLFFPGDCLQIVAVCLVNMWMTDHKATRR